MDSSSAPANTKKTLAAHCHHIFGIFLCLCSSSRRVQYLDGRFVSFLRHYLPPTLLTFLALLSLLPPRTSIGIPGITNTNLLVPIIYYNIGQYSIILIGAAGEFMLLVASLLLLMMSIVLGMTKKAAQATTCITTALAITIMLLLLPLLPWEEPAMAVY